MSFTRRVPCDCYENNTPPYCESGTGTNQFLRCCYPPYCCADTGGLPEQLLFTTLPSDCLLAVGYLSHCCEGLTFILTYDEGEDGWIGEVDTSGCIGGGYHVRLKFTCDRCTGETHWYYDADTGTGTGESNWVEDLDRWGGNIGILSCDDDTGFNSLCDPLVGTWGLCDPFARTGLFGQWLCVADCPGVPTYAIACLAGTISAVA